MSFSISISGLYIESKERNFLLSSKSIYLLPALKRERVVPRPVDQVPGSTILRILKCWVKRSAPRRSHHLLCSLCALHFSKSTFFAAFEPLSYICKDFFIQQARTQIHSSLATSPRQSNLILKRVLLMRV